MTHDQVEAMTMGDRITVMKDGNIMQVAEPLNLYNDPANIFVAGFIGSPPMNFLHGTLEAADNRLAFVEKNSKARPVRLELNDELSRRGADHVGKPIVFGIRPENVQDALHINDSDPTRTAAINVEVAEPMGHETYLYLDTGAHSFIARVRSDHRFETGRPLDIVFDLENGHLFDGLTELALK